MYFIWVKRICCTLHLLFIVHKLCINIQINPFNIRASQTSKFYHINSSSMCFGAETLASGLLTVQFRLHCMLHVLHVQKITCNAFKLINKRYKFSTKFLKLFSCAISFCWANISIDFCCLCIFMFFVQMRFAIYTSKCVVCLLYSFKLLCLSLQFCEKRKAIRMTMETFILTNKEQTQLCTHTY